MVEYHFNLIQYKVLLLNVICDMEDKYKNMRFVIGSVSEHYLLSHSRQQLESEHKSNAALWSKAVGPNLFAI